VSERSAARRRARKKARERFGFFFRKRDVDSHLRGVVLRNAGLAIRKLVKSQSATFSLSLMFSRPRPLAIAATFRTRCAVEQDVYQPAAARAFAEVRLELRAHNDLRRRKHVTTRRNFLKTTAAALGAAALPRMGLAQQWPSKPIRAMIPFGAGSSIDILGRLVTDPLAQALGQPIIIDNRGGAGGSIGTAVVAKAEADGYTILINASAHSPRRRFTPICRTTRAAILRPSRISA
jgi:hypothetical protein